MTQRALKTTSHAVLALLSFAPMSGYELASATDRSISHFWPISKPQVYKELQRLAGLGLVEATDVVQERLPDKRIYRLTRAGERVLDDWLVDGSLEAERFRLPFLVKMLVGHRVGAGQMRKLLGDYRAAAQAEHEELARLDGLLAQTPEAIYARATVLFGLKVSAAVAEWTDEVERLLPEGSIKIDARREQPDNALRLLGSLPGRRGSGGRR
jgi:PadR family transcriptional regulator AphA